MILYLSYSAMYVYITVLVVLIQHQKKNTMKQQDMRKECVNVFPGE